MRSFLAGLLVLVATLLAPVAIGSTWVWDRVADTDSYVETVAPLAEDPALRSELAQEVSQVVSASLDENVSVPLPDTVDDWVGEAAAAVVRSDGFPELWREANRELHSEVERLVATGEDVDEDEWVRIDLSPLLTPTLERLAERGVPVSLLPEITLEVPVVRESVLAEQRDRYELARDVARVAVPALVLVVLAAVAIAPGWRGRLRTGGLAGLGIALGAVLAMLASGPISDLAAEQAEESRSGLARLITETVMESLAPYARTWLLVAAPLGLVLLLLSLLPARGAGRTR